MSGSITQAVRSKVQEMEPGALFGYEQFSVADGNELSIAKALSRLSKEGIIRRVVKGKYFKPKKSIFGELRPTEGQLLNILTERDGQKTGYLTGIASLNLLGLTTQIPNTLEIAVNRFLPPKVIERQKFKFTKRTVPITESNIPLLQLLDAFRSIKRVPGTGVNEAYKRLIYLLKKLSQEERNLLVELASYYNPSTRALLGATLEIHLKDQRNAEKMLETLNPLSSYRIGIKERLLPNKSNWKIK